MNQDAANVAATPVRSPRHWQRWLIALMALTGFATSLPWLLPPERIADFLLHQIGPMLQLDITRSGAATWRLRGGPTLEVYGLEIRQVGANTPWFQAERALLAIPWRGVRSLGCTLDITRVELDKPTFDLPTFRHWLDTRASGNEGVPAVSISGGFSLKNGELHENGWKIENIFMHLPNISPENSVHANLSGHYTDTATHADFDLNLAMTRPVLPAGAAIVGKINLAHDTISIPAQFTLSAPLQLKDGQWQISAFKLALVGEFFKPETLPLPFTINASGKLEADDVIVLSPLALELTGSGTLPSLTATGKAEFAEDISLHLTGSLPYWPDAWPALPAPLNQHGKFGFTLSYTGTTDFNSLLALQLQHNQTRLDVALRPSILSEWLSHHQTSPLPPLQGRLTTPTLTFPGMALHGIVIESEP